MLGEAALRRLAEQALAASRADQTEVLLSATHSALTRFAHNAIHQNVAESDTSLTVRAALGQRVGVASGNQVTPETASQLVERALEIARLPVENPDVPGLPAPRPATRVDGYVAATAECPPRARAEAVGVICRRAAEAGLRAFGALSTESTELAVATSLGQFCYHPSTTAELNIVAMSDTSSGYADRLSADLGQIDPEAAAAEAVHKALRGRNPRELPPGEYEVVLEEYAVSDIVDFLAYLGFSALAVQEQRSFLTGKLGQRVMSPEISIWDDGTDPGGLPMPFDFEGVPKARLDLIEQGIARGLCYDSQTAAREGRPSTGHALPPGQTFGPVPLNLFMASGKTPRHELARGIERGVWVTRFWYTRHVHPLALVVTGMTRDGAFLIEKGEVGPPVRNLRFTQSYLAALNDVRAVANETRLERSLFSANRVPALRLGSFTFTGATEF